MRGAFTKQTACCIRLDWPGLIHLPVGFSPRYARRPSLRHHSRTRRRTPQAPTFHRGLEARIPHRIDFLNYVNFKRSTSLMKVRHILPRCGRRRSLLGSAGPTRLLTIKMVRGLALAKEMS